MSRKLTVNLGSRNVEFVDPPELAGFVGFERYEFVIAKVGTLVVYYRIANEHVDVTRNVAAYAPTIWIDIEETIT